jgi:hypothetical protein
MEKSFEFRPSDFFKVEYLVEEVCYKYNVPHEYFGTIIIALQEAIHLLDPAGEEQKKLKIKFRKTPNAVIFRIQDGLQENYDLFLAASKRAISSSMFILKSLADEVKIDAKKDYIEITFKMSGISKDTFYNRSIQLENYLGQKLPSKHKQKN